MFFYILLTLSLLLIYYYFYWKNKDYWRKQNLTQINGVMWKFLLSGRSLSEIYKEIYDKHEDDHIGLFLGNDPGVMLKSLDDLQAVLAGDFHKFYSRGILKNPSDVLADNILFIDEFQRWKILRSKFSPVFTSLRLKTMFVPMEKCAKDFVDLITTDKNMKDKPLDALYTYTTASIGASVFGIETISNKNTMESPFIDMVRNSLKPSLKLNMKIFISSLSPTLFRWLDLKLFGEHEEFFIGAMKQVLEKRRNSERLPDFIDLCLELQKQGTMKDPTTGYELEPTDEVMAAQAFFFFLAGVETSAITMHFTLLELSSNPKVLSKLHDEIDAVFENDTQELTYNNLEKLQYLDMVISEAMRKYPPIGNLHRKCTKDAILPTNNLKVKKDTIMVIPIYAIHRDENLFPDPEKFDPQRFDPNDMKVKKYSFLGFGEGNRLCLGARYARLQMKIGLVALLRKFTLAEQSYRKTTFPQSPFAIRDPDGKFHLIPRVV